MSKYLTEAGIKVIEFGVIAICCIICLVVILVVGYLISEMLKKEYRYNKQGCNNSNCRVRETCGRWIYRYKCTGCPINIASVPDHLKSRRIRHEKVNGNMLDACLNYLTEDDMVHHRIRIR